MNGRFIGNGDEILKMCADKSLFALLEVENVKFSKKGAEHKFVEIQKEFEGKKMPIV